MELLRDRLRDLPPADVEAAARIEQRASQVLRPRGALARLDGVAAWVAAWQRTATPTIRRPHGLVFAADHGVAANAPVSAYPADVTAAMVEAFGRRVATMSVFADHVGAGLEVVDVGVGRPTGDLRVEPAVSPERFDEVTRSAFEAVDRLDADLLVLGELGIGNTTAAAAVAAALDTAPLDHEIQAADDADARVARWVGHGSGVDADGLTAKRAAVGQAIGRVAGVSDPLEVLRQVGGAELVGIAAAIVAARHRRLPVVLDGYICTAAALPLLIAEPTALDHCTAGHRSAEPGHRLLLDRLHKAPLLDLDMRLGEGSGAMAAVPLIRLACAGVVEVATFDEFLGTDGQP